MSETISVWEFNRDSLSEFMQSVKSVILNDLYNNDLISEETFDIYEHKKFLILRKPSFFTNIWKKMFSYKEDNEYIILCTAETLHYKEEDDDDESTNKVKIIPFNNDLKKSE